MTVPVVPPPPPAARGGRERTLVGLGIALAAVVLAGAVTLVVLGLRAGDGAWPGAGEAPAPGTTPGEVGGTAAPGEPDGDEPPADASPATPGEEPRPTSSPLPGERPEGFDELAAQVSALRGLPAEGSLDARVVPPDDLATKVTELAFAEYDDREIEFDQRLLAALRLLDEGDDLRATIEDLYSAQILGLYVVEERVLYIGGDGPSLTAAQRVTAAHEVAHALQDLAFDLEAFMDLDEGDTDAQLARLALVEGDAMLTQELWSLEHQSPQERQQAQQETLEHSPDALLRAPAYVRESLLFPYTHGVRFVEQLVLDGGFAAIDAAFADPPASTRHILRPDTYLAGERHAGADVATSPGQGWDEASAYTFGEFDVDQWLSALGEERAEVTAGWDGGLARHWHRGDEDAVALALRLSTPQAASAACAAAPAWYAAVAGGEDSGGLLQGDRDWMAYTCSETGVLVGLGPDAATAERLAGR